MRSETKGSLERHLPHSPPTEDELFAMRRAWRKQGIAVLRPGDICDEWARQAIVNLANRIYGGREDSR